VRTERTILSPFTKEYRVRAANSSIRLFLEGAFPFWEGPNESYFNFSAIYFIFIE
jgi:hypothetical protein